MSFLSEDELKKIPFFKLGKNVKISKDARLYNPELMEIGDNSRIDDFCVLSGKIIIGKNVHVATGCILAGSIQGLFLHDFSNLSYQVKIFCRSDDYSGESLTNATIPSKYKKLTDKSVHVNKHVIIGAGSIVFLGAHIAEGCAIGAMSTVTKPTEEWKIYVGTPAQAIKNRSKNLLELEKKFLGEQK